MASVRLRELTHRYGRTEVIRGVSLDIEHDKRVRETAELLQIEPLLDRLPRSPSP